MDGAEAHGSLCGQLCVLGDLGGRAWLAEVLPPFKGKEGWNTEARHQLKALWSRTLEALEGSDMAFQLLLPEDDLPLADRVDSLALWCHGFNQALALAGRNGEAEVELATGNTEEIVRDFSALAQMSVGDEATDGEGEAAYAEIIEYVRVGVQLVYEECTLIRRRLNPSDSL